MMRTTLSLDEDVAAKLKAEMRRSGRSFKETVNGYLRLGLSARRASKPSRQFEVRPGSLQLRPGLSVDCIGQLIDELDGRSGR